GDAAETGTCLVTTCPARFRVGIAADDDVRLAAFELDEPHRLLGRPPVDVGGCHRRTLASGQRGNGPAVAHRRVWLRRRPRPRADHQDAPFREPGHSAYRSSRPRAMTRRWTSLVPSPMIISGASR